MPDPPSDSATDPAAAAAVPPDRAARIGEIVDRLKACLHELDQLQLWKPAAHLSLTLSAIELEDPAAVDPRP